MDTMNTIVKMVMDRWYASIKSCDSILNTISNEQLKNEIAPNKNRGVYLLGHLIAVHDDMMILLNLGEKLYPELQKPFIELPDKVGLEIMSTNELRAAWTNQCELMKQKFESLETETWFEKHTAVTAEDFVKEPHRNKLNIVLTRTTHLQYHLGQLSLLK